MVIFFVQNLPSSHDEADEYSGDDEEVKQATTPPQEKNKTQADKDKVLFLICSKYCLYKLHKFPTTLHRFARFTIAYCFTKTILDQHIGRKYCRKLLLLN